MKPKYKLFIIVGARPQIMKAAALARAIDKSDRSEFEIIHSGQHYDDNLSAKFFKEFGLKDPKYNLEIGSEKHNIFIAKFMLEFDPILEKENPDMVIVVGDTNTTAAAAIASSKRNIPLAHVEAGLREWNKAVPEEINKLLTDSVSDLFFSPTNTGVDNLIKAGVSKHVYMTGDITFDLLSDPEVLWDEQKTRSEFELNSDYIFLTCHREANTDIVENLTSIVDAISKIMQDIIWPLHPRTRKALVRFNLLEKLGKHVKLIDPISFRETQSLVKYAHMVITDSGGIIKEAYFHKTPGVIIDTQTEWVETVDEGWNTIAGPDRSKILAAVNDLEVPTEHRQSLGDGNAGIRIIDAIEGYLEKRRAEG